MPDFLDDLAADVMAGLDDIGRAITVRTVTTYQPKANATAAIGATSVVLGTLPAGFDRVLIGDTFSHGGKTYTVAADAMASGGTITATFTPALTAQISSGAVVTITRTADYTATGWTERADTSTAVAPGISVNDFVANVFVASLAIVPKAQDRVVIDGAARTIKNVGKDIAGCVWQLHCSG